MSPEDRRHAWILVLIALVGLVWLAVAAWLGFSTA